MTGWECILRDAESALASATSRVRRIKRAIRTIKRKIAAGESLPDYLEEERMEDGGKNTLTETR